DSFGIAAFFAVTADRDRRNDAYGDRMTAIAAATADAVREDRGGVVLRRGEVAAVGDLDLAARAPGSASTADREPAGAVATVAAAAADTLRENRVRAAVDVTRVLDVHEPAVAGARAAAAAAAQIEGAEAAAARAAATADALREDCMRALAMREDVASVVYRDFAA